MTEITRWSFTKAIHEAVAERGRDYVYESKERGCRYQRDGEPSCLIGVVLDKLGVEYNPGWEGKGASVVLNRIWVYDSGFHYAADAAQRIQDNGETWGKALDAYDSYLEEI